jgi:hypothetical protein
MESRGLARALRNTEAALRGLGAALPSGEIPPVSLLVPLAVIGDSLRLGLEISGSIRRWTDGIRRADLAAALAALIEETATWSLPDPENAAVEGDPVFALVLRRRDEADSIRLAIRRICIPKGIDPYGVPEFVQLADVLARLDETLQVMASRDDVARLLGDRAAMQPKWADGFRDEAEATNCSELSAEQWTEAVAQTSPPSDEVIATYVNRGVLNRYVEGVAAGNEGFAEELAACIDALLDARENVGLVARRWRKHARVASVTDPLQFEVVPATRLAAATGHGSELVETELRLGVLPPLDAVARIVVTSQGVTVFVSEDEKAIERLEMGNAIATSPTEPGYWTLVLSPVPRGPVSLRVLGADGAEFAEELEFLPIDASHEAH